MSLRPSTAPIDPPEPFVVRLALAWRAALAWLKAVLRPRRATPVAMAGRNDGPPDLLGAQLRDRHGLVRLERIRKAPLEAGVGGVAELAERAHHRLLPFLHDEEAAAEPDPAAASSSSVSYTHLTLPTIYSV